MFGKSRFFGFLLLEIKTSIEQFQQVEAIISNLILQLLRFVKIQTNKIK